MYTLPRRRPRYTPYTGRMERWWRDWSATHSHCPFSPTRYLSHRVVTDVAVLRFTHLRVHTLRKELPLTPPTHSHILRTLYLPRVHVTHLVHTTVASSPDTLQQRIILSQLPRILLYHAHSLPITRNNGCSLRHSFSPTPHASHTSSPTGIKLLFLLRVVIPHHIHSDTRFLSSQQTTPIRSQSSQDTPS